MYDRHAEFDWPERRAPIQAAPVPLWMRPAPIRQRPDNGNAYRLAGVAVFAFVLILVGV